MTAQSLPLLSMGTVTALRAETPGCAELIHFNNASCALPSQRMLTVIRDHLMREAMDGPSEAGLAVADAVQGVRHAAARLLNAEDGEIALMGSGSQAWGMVFASLPPLRQGDRVLIGRHEWGGNVASLQRAVAPSGATLEVIPCDEYGLVSPQALAAMMDSRVRLVSLTWCPATNGLINPAAEIGQITRAAGVPYMIDAGQALGQLPIDVRALNCDMLKGAGRKALRGPRGTAVLYVRRQFLDRLDPPWVDVLAAPWQDDRGTLRADARRFESSENPFALQLGLGEALRQTLAIGVPAIRAHIRTMADVVRAGLAALPTVTLHDGGVDRSGLVTFSVAGRSAVEVRDILARQRITVGAIAAAYTPLDMKARGLTEVVRASVGMLTTPEECTALVEAVDALH